jgi:hypothetical protein
MSIWLKLGLVGVLIASGIAYHILDKRNAVQTAVEAQRAIYEAQLQVEINKAQEASISLLNSALDDIKKKDEEIKNINSKYAALSRSLQQRPSRKDSSSASGNPSTCTGAELLREDGEFLAGEAARADRILKERDYYYEQYKRAREALASHQKSNG